MNQSNNQFKLAPKSKRKLKKSKSCDVGSVSPPSDVSRPTLKKRRTMIDLNQGIGSSSIISGTGLSYGRSQTCDVKQSSSSAVSAETPITPHVMRNSTMFQNAHDFSISGNSTFHNQNIGSVTNVYRGGTNSLERLEKFVSFDAQFNSSAQDPDRQCHPGTREHVLKRLRVWINNPKAKERIFWIYGPAGAGKSAIAQTIARSYARPKVAATFFFFRSDTNRNDGNRLFTTLVYQLALSLPLIKDHVISALSEHPDFPRTDVETQFRLLLAEPFRVLNEDATHQLAPAVYAIIDIIKGYQELAPVIIIDGVDECIDDNIQQRFLKVIGDAVADNLFPLRFLILSRPELHIERTIHRFKAPVVRIDLAEFNDANQDIEIYLEDEFSRIASEQNIESTWPGSKVIRHIVYKSSGNFILPSLINRFVGDPYCFAKTQLDIIMNMKPPKKLSPFAALDQLFLEILGRVPDQGFLKRYLALLTVRISVSGSSSYDDFHKDDALLMHVSEAELQANLRRMRSLLKLEDRIEVYHRSFLDFLHDASRSGQYYVGQKSGIRRYLMVFVDSLVQYVSTAIRQPNHHDAPHFMPRFRMAIKDFPLKIELPVNEWPEVMNPLLDLQDKLLQMSTSHGNSDFLRCDKCNVFYLLRELLHIGLHLEIFKGEFDESVRKLQKRRGVFSSITAKRKKDGKNLDDILLSLFAHLPETMKNWSPNKTVIKLIEAMLSFDSTETANKIRFVSDAQKLVDLLVYLIDKKNTLSEFMSDVTRGAILLALEIFARVPILPLPTFLDGREKNKLHPVPWTNGIPINILSQTILASRILDRHYIIPMLVVEKGFKGEDGVWLVSGDAGRNDLSMEEWRQTSVLSPRQVVQVMLALAKAIQYFHSLGIILHGEFGSNDVFLDLELRPKVRCLCTFSHNLLEKSSSTWFSPADNVFSFGCLFYELFSTLDNAQLFSPQRGKDIIPYRPSHIPEHDWQLIQQCCSQNPGSRPAIDNVVQEIEKWEVE